MFMCSETAKGANDEEHNPTRLVRVGSLGNPRPLGFGAGVLFSLVGGNQLAQS
jgi:hypothetical protein